MYRSTYVGHRRKPVVFYSHSFSHHCSVDLNLSKVALSILIENTYENHKTCEQLEVIYFEKFPNAAEASECFHP